MAQTILYYPSIDIQDGAWLRSAILYWDEVSSIVPDEGYRTFSPEIQYLQDAGVYSPIYPRDLFFSEYAEEFCKTVEKRIERYSRSLSKSGCRSQNGWTRVHKKKIYDPALHTMIHYRKLPAGLLSLLQDKKFISDYNDDGWMEMDGKVAQIYMRTLAEYSIKCADKDIVLGTDNIKRNEEIYNRSRTHTDIQTQCCTIDILSCLPQPSMNMHFEEILDFKMRRKNELDAFTGKIRELERNVHNADSIEMIRHYEAEFIEGWECCSNDFQRVLTEARIQFFLSSLTGIVAIPLVGSFLAGHMGQDAVEFIQNVTPFVQFGISYLDYKNKINPLQTDGGFSYIFKARKAGIIRG